LQCTVFDISWPYSGSSQRFPDLIAKFKGSYTFKEWERKGQGEKGELKEESGRGQS